MSSSASRTRRPIGTARLLTSTLSLFRIMATKCRYAVLVVAINEGGGLQHMKLYGIDDEIILSGWVFAVRTEFNAVAN